MVPPRITKMNCLAWNSFHYYNFLRILAPKKKERKCSGQKSKALSAFFKVSKNSLGNLYWDKIYTRATWINLIWMPLSLIRIYCSHCWPWIWLWGYLVMGLQYVSPSMVLWQYWICMSKCGLNNWWELRKLAPMASKFELKVWVFIWRKIYATTFDFERS